MPPGPRPPNHYELLGLTPLESSRSVIAAAADRRIVEAEESVLASAQQIRRVVDRIQLAKACLFDQQAKTEYDRQLNHGAAETQLGPMTGADSLAGTGPVAGPDSMADAPADELRFEAIPAELIEAARPIPKRKTRRLFWTLTLIEGLCLIGLFFYLRHPEPVAMPKLVVRSRTASGPAESTSPPAGPVVQPPPQRPAEPGERVLTRGPFEPGDPFAPSEPSAPGEPAAPEETTGDNESASLTEPENNAEAMPPPTARSAESAEEAPPGMAPAPSRPIWPNKWMLTFASNSDGTIDDELLPLSAEEIKTLGGLREQPLYMVRDAITKKPTAALPFDNQGHLSGIVVALLRKNDWHACLSYNNQVLQGRLRIFDAERRCVFFADYRSKGRTRLLCLCSGGVPLAVQIWRGKDSVAYLVELVEGRPFARQQKQLSPAQTERLGAALAEIASIEGVIRDLEKDWKSQLSDWWKTNDNALRSISVQPIADGEKLSRKTAYYKKLFDEQHAGLDKLLSQFEPLPADSAIPKP
ncbi:MAG TPA: hypothetical protein VHY91_05230 [Pirellulales bacterium]|nr:hypothetical protein [Pirellulales bacterium]